MRNYIIIGADKTSNKEQLERNLNEWKDKVMRSFDGASSVNTYHMIVDVDRIIAEAFDHEPVIQEIRRK